MDRLCHVILESFFTLARLCIHSLVWQLMETLFQAFKDLLVTLKGCRRCETQDLVSDKEAELTGSGFL